LRGKRVLKEFVILTNVSKDSQREVSRMFSSKSDFSSRKASFQLKFIYEETDAD
jgi:hypothetical protein